MNVTTSSDHTFTLVYNMSRVDGAWLVRNIIVDGINLGLSYRSQFKSMMSEPDITLDKVIATWSVDMEQPDAV